MNRRDAEAAYSVLSQVLADGPDADSLTPLRASPLVAAALEAYATHDEVAVDHEHAFGLNVPLFAGAFLEADRQVGGATGEALAAAYARLGFAADPCGPGTEHLSTVLAVLAQVRVDGAFIDAHLLSWLPIVSIAVRSLGRAYPAALVDQIEGLVLLHRGQLPDPCEARYTLPAAELDLDDSETDLRAIGEWLATPARSGIYLSRADIARVGGLHRVPRGFGERSQLVVNLLRSAASFDTFDAVISEIEELVAERRAEMAGPRYAEVASALSPWVARAGETYARLAGLRGRAAHIG